MAKGARIRTGTVGRVRRESFFDAGCFVRVIPLYDKLLLAAAISVGCLFLACPFFLNKKSQSHGSEEHHLRYVSLGVSRGFC